jgi:hypothetical protein
VERGGFGCPLGILRTPEGGKSGINTMGFILVFEIAIFLIAVGGCVAGIFIARKWLRSSK